MWQPTHWYNWVESEADMDFATALKEHLEAEPKLRKRGKKILKIIDGPDSPRRTRQLDRMERHARAEIGFTGRDWAAVDWKSIIEIILKLLLALLPFILTEEPED